ncbi:unnamed protein product [Plutella xylostella]|uniref:(diamondback moth) hypothetical protein n=1 Tax=Plutella xylostella TaxID=51655 RepID=A0A8S4G0H5_PLUXY|nr:unnamed protein product [Plutella xylostella]
MNDYMMMTAATIPTFSGADPAYPAARWVEDFSDNAEVCGWSPPQKLLIARRVLTGVAGLWLRTENKFMSFEELQRALLEEFPDKVDTKHIHELMSDRERKMAASAKEETRSEQPTYVSVKQDPGQRQSSGYRCQSEMSVKQHSMFGVRTDEANDYSKEKEVTSIKTKENEYEKCQRQAEVVVLQNKKEELFKEAPIELNSIKEILEPKVEEVKSQIKIVEDKGEKVVEKEYFSDEVPCVVKKKDCPKMRKVDNRLLNKKVYEKRCVEEYRQYQHGSMENEISYIGNEENIMEKEIAKRVHESCYFSARIMKDAMTKYYHVLR